MLRSVFTTYLARFSAMLTTFLLLPVVSGAVGLDAYGIYALTVSVGMLFQQDLGMGAATTRFIAGAKPTNDIERMREVSSASSAFFTVVAIALTAAVAITFSVIWPGLDLTRELAHDALLLAWLGCANVFFILVFSTHRHVLAGIGNLDDVNALLICQSVFRIGLTLGVLAAGGGIVAVAAVDLVSTIAFGLSTLIDRRRRMPALRPSAFRAEWRVFREIFRVSSQLLVLTVASVIIMQAGSIIVSLLLPVAMIAVFAAAQRLFVLIKEVTNSLSSAVLPTASMQHAADDHAANSNLYLQGTRLANMLMMLVLVPLLIFMDQIVITWAGADLLPAASVAQILILSMLANNNHLLAIPILTAQGDVRTFALLHTIWALSGIALSTLLGSLWGLNGVAFGMTLPILLLEPLYIGVTLRRLSLTWRQFLSQVVVPSFVLVTPLAACLYLATQLLQPDLPVAALLTIVWLAAACTVYIRFGLGPNLRRSILASVVRLIPGRGHV